MSAYDPISVDVEELKFLADRLRMIAPEALKAWRKESRALGEDIVNDAKALSRSTRIADTIRAKPTPWGNVVVSAGGGDAYIAPIIENKGEGFVKHPTFGHQPITNKNGLPAFLHPALNANRGKAIVALSAAVNEAIHAAELED